MSASTPALNSTTPAITRQIASAGRRWARGIKQTSLSFGDAPQSSAAAGLPWYVSDVTLRRWRIDTRLWTFVDPALVRARTPGPHTHPAAEQDAPHPRPLEIP